jgi:hypothetical protein
MVNEQFTWLTPFSQQAQPELTWRNQRREGAEPRIDFAPSAHGEKKNGSTTLP